jgi:hypothetical protein
MTIYSSQDCWSFKLAKRLPESFASSAGFLLALAAACAPLQAFALAGGSGIDPNSQTSPYLGVGSLHTNDGYFSATLIAPGYAITAAHVLAGKSASDVTFQINGDTPYSMTGAQIFVNPGWTGFNASSDGLVHNDLAIIKLSTDAPATVPYYSLYTGPMAGKAMTFVSYAGTQAQKSTGMNMADIVFNGTNPATQGTNEVFLFDYDGPTLSTNHTGGGTLGANQEATFVGGDSGSAAFVDDNGVMKLAGVNTFAVFFSGGPTQQGAFGTGGGGQILSGYSTWIDSVVTAPVPEPQTWLMLVAGLGLVGGASLGRRARRQS